MPHLPNVNNLNDLCGLFRRKYQKYLPEYSFISTDEFNKSIFHRMPTNEQTDVIIYRVRETGLEVFLVRQSQLEGGIENLDSLQAPSAGEYAPDRLATHYIALDPVTDANGDTRNAIAIEADWHEIPSLRALIYEDYRVAKEKARHHLKNFLPAMEQGAFVAVKEAVKRIMPSQYAFLKELKDIVTEQNQTKYL